MENASKALIIAGGMLIAIFIISLGVYLFSNAGSFSDSYAKRVSQDELNKFNNKFLIYAKDLTPHEMVSVINLVAENNKKNEGIPENQITLIIDGTTINVNSKTQEWKNSLMEKADNENKTKYNFTAVSYNEDSGRVEKLVYSTSE